MQNELRKLAKMLREKSKKDKIKKAIKCAQIVQAGTALELIRRKIGV